MRGVGDILVWLDRIRVDGGGSIQLVNNGGVGDIPEEGGEHGFVVGFVEG